MTKIEHDELFEKYSHEIEGCCLKLVGDKAASFVMTCHCFMDLRNTDEIFKSDDDIKSFLYIKAKLNCARWLKYQNKKLCRKVSLN